MYIEVIDSTQKYMINNISDFKDMDFLYSKIQTNGYGRTGLWDSKNENIYYSKKIKNTDDSWLYVICAMHMFASKYIANLRIKLPNDLYYDNLKLGGFIIEPILDNLVIGIGINVYEKSDGRTSIYELNKNDYCIDNLINELNSILNDAFSLSIDELFEYYQFHTYILNNEITCTSRVDNSRINGIVTKLEKAHIYIDNRSYNIMELKFN